MRLEKGFTDVFAAQVLSYFWLSSIFGRAVIGFLTKKIKITYILLGITFLSIISIIGGIYAKNNTLVIIAFILTGIFLSGIWPLIVTEGGLQYPYNRNSVVAIIVFFGGLGGLSAPLLLSMIYNNSGLLTAMNLNYIFLILVFVFILVLVFLNRRTYHTKRVCLLNLSNNKNDHLHK